MRNHEVENAVSWKETSCLQEKYVTSRVLIEAPETQKLNIEWEKTENLKHIGSTQAVVLRLQ